ncbi:MAG TPA: neocarzinostatin apoprotein domain-containing protein, partial [Acidimicrobiales bacterium]|nr:neocarzinostatin apoprotein domain-containing protein [Acidimicrobiales bacterium]
MKINRLSRLAAAAAISTLAASVGLVVAAPSAFAASPTASINPSTNLTDGESVQVSGSSYDPNTPIQVLECAGTVSAPPSDAASGCDGTTLQTGPSLVTGSTGAFSNIPITVYVIPGATITSSPIQCDFTHSCVLYVGEDKNNFSGAPKAFVALNFQAPPTHVNPPTGAPTGPYNLNYSPSGATTTFNPAAGLTAVDGNGVAETINTPTVTVVGTATGGLACASATSCTYTGNGATTTAVTDKFTLAFTATCTEPCSNPTTSTPPTQFTPYTVNVAAKPANETSASNPVETTISGSSTI